MTFTFSSPYYHATASITTCLVNFLIPLSIASTLIPSSVRAAPSAAFPSKRALGAGGSSSNGTSLTPQVWIPIVVIALTLLAIAILTCTRGSWRARLASWGAGAALASGTVTGITSSTNGTRELTAEQLAGPGNATATNTNTNATTPATRARRARRTRRTPSQISTRSLPAYMKEPGEQELVIYRGPSDMEDASTAVLDMPTLDEHGTGTESPISSLTMSRSTTRDYVPMPESPHDMPLLQQDESSTETAGDQDRSSTNLLPPQNARVRDRPSFDTLMSTEESQSESALIRAHPHPPALDPRGEAPPYFEVIAMDNLVSTGTSSTNELLVPRGLDTPELLTPSTATTGASTPDPFIPEQQQQPQPQEQQQSDPVPRRRSAFFGLFNSRPNSVVRPPVPPIPNAIPPPTNTITPSRTSHTRGESSVSALSIPTTSGDSHTPSRSPTPNHIASVHDRTRSRSTHRPSHSGGSNSVFSIGSQALRSLTRQKSFSSTRHSNFLDAHLNSPSTISLNSISSPLTHTLVRTEFTYPKSGPTPEQLKLISSRESFARFGVPYGRDAIAAYHASQSRVDVESLGPPPNFEDVAGSGSGAGRLGSPVPSAIASVGVGSPSSAVFGSASVSQSAGVGEDGDLVGDEVEVGPSEEREHEEEEEQEEEREQEQEMGVPGRSDSLDVPPRELSARPSHSQLASSISSSSSSTSQPPPPSSFKGKGTIGPNVNRSESRASSFMSYATAEESLHSDSSSVSPGTPVIPKLLIPSRSSASLRSQRVGASSRAGEVYTLGPVDDDDDDDEAVSPTPIAPHTPRTSEIRLGLHGKEDTDVTITSSSASSISMPVGSLRR